MFSNYDYAFIRDYVEQYVSAIAGTWYEVSDDPGILVLDYDFSATYELYGSIYSGEYNFDEALNLGTLILGDAYYQIELSGELLMLIDNEGGAYYFSREEGGFLLRRFRAAAEVVCDQTLIRKRKRIDQLNFKEITNEKERP